MAITLTSLIWKTTPVTLSFAYMDIQLVQRTGSKYICSPPVLNTDEDYIVYTQNYEDLSEVLALDGWECNSEMYAGNDFHSWKNNEKINLIITENKAFFDKWVVATEIAKQQNLLNKSDRIALFNKILYGPIMSLDF